MEFIQRSLVQTVLILKADRLCAETLRELTLQVLPASKIRLANSIPAAASILARESIDLLLTGTGTSLNGDVVDFLADCVTSPGRPRRILIVTAHDAQRVFGALRALPIQGVFDSAAEPPEQFTNALKAVVEGGRYWSRSVVERTRRATAISRLLTPCEELVLSILGDGSDIVVAARELGLSPQTITTIRRELHRKLGVQHRGELMRVAAQTGFVRFTPSGVLRPGFATQSAQYRARQASRLAASCQVGT
jgi:DNA-binding NarL/FixJ family response regulator